MFPHFFYGGDYNPEQWSRDVWLEDARLMQEAGVNLVSLGIFAWARIEPSQGKYDFSWLDEVMALLYEHDVRVDLATPTASPPPWLVHLHPEMLPVNVDGVKLWHGSRRHYCPHSTAYRESARHLVTQLAEHVRRNPALAMWHVDNEYACHVTECFCEASGAAFRQWLQRRYGSLEAFNEAWGTSFWSQHYGDWEEVMPPLRTPASVNPMQRLDWQRFCSDSWLECFADQRAILRKITPDIPLTTNFMRFHRPLDYWKWAAQEDVVSFDSYPDTSDPGWMVESAMGFDLMRSLKGGQGWILMEQAPTHVNWREQNTTKRPGVMRLGSYQAMARGADGIMFFQWRASRAGSEKFHSAVIPHAGINSRVWREAKELGGELKRFDALISSRVQAQAAIVFDWENWWALESGDKPLNDLKLLPGIMKFYSELFRRNITIDFVHPDADLSRYRLVIAPHLYLVDGGSAQNMERYVENGGTLLMNFFSGIVDGSEHVWLGGYPAPFRRMLGLWIEEFAPYAQAQTNLIATRDGMRFVCDRWSDIIHLEGAESVAAYCEDYFALGPAITRHRFGKGSSYYCGTSLGQDGLAWLLALILKDIGSQAASQLPPGIEMTRRTDGVHTWLFLLNHSDRDVQMDLPAEGTDLVTGTSLGGSLQLKPRGVAIIQESKA